MLKPLSRFGKWTCVLVLAGNLLLQPVSDFALSPPSQVKKNASLGVRVLLNRDEAKSLAPTYRRGVRAFWDDEKAWRTRHPSAVLVYLLRHAQSSANARHVTQTENCYDPLSLRGWLQSRFLRRFLGNVPFTDYVSSDAERPYKTIRPTVALQGRLERVRLDPRLREVPNWSVGGIPIETARKIFKERFHIYCTDIESYAVPGKPSFQRTKALLGEMLGEWARSGERNILASSHGFTILFTIMEALGIRLNKFFSVMDMLDVPGNAAITVMAYHPNTQHWELLVYGDNSYLPGWLREKPWTITDRARGEKREPFAEFLHRARAYARLWLDGAGIVGPERELAGWLPTAQTFSPPSIQDIKLSLTALQLQEVSL